MTKITDGLSTDYTGMGLKIARLVFSDELMIDE
jgi:hypothetical protein